MEKGVRRFREVRPTSVMSAMDALDKSVDKMEKSRLRSRLIIEAGEHAHGAGEMTQGPRKEWRSIGVRDEEGKQVRPERR